MEQPERLGCRVEVVSAVLKSTQDSVACTWGVMYREHVYYTRLSA
jgi:hypothetical protein